MPIRSRTHKSLYKLGDTIIVSYGSHFTKGLKKLILLLVHENIAMPLANIFFFLSKQQTLLSRDIVPHRVTWFNFCCSVLFDCLRLVGWIQ